MKDFADQRNYAKSLAVSEWVFYVDADERATPALWTEVREAVRGPYDAYRVPHLFVSFGAPLRHGGWYPQYHVRLHRRTMGIWTGAVHEVLRIDGSVGTLREPLRHFAHPSVHSFLVKLNRYTALEAERIERPVILLALLAALVPAPYFVYKYIAQLGFLDGWRGLAAALLLSCYRCVTYVRALERRAKSTERK